MKTISLFAGCGGMDIGAERAGASIILSNDNYHDACETLRKYFPDTQVEDCDVADLTEFPAADIVIGGYPCQSFSLAGNRDPEKDVRTKLYLHFVRCLSLVKPQYFVAENVSGLKGLKSGAFFKEQIQEFESQGYNVSAHVVASRDYGIPQVRKRLFIVGIHKDLKQAYLFPEITHGKATRKMPHLLPYTSHGEAIKHLPLWPTGEFYERPHDPTGHMSWYYMSRNRKKKWDEPSFTIVANWRHITLHPACQTMELEWSNLADGWKQKWRFSGEYEHIVGHPDRPILEEPRRLSWRECALIQTFPRDFEPVGNIESKFTQIGNAVPPDLAEIIIGHLLSGDGLISEDMASEMKDQLQLAI
jgi:DNA (cytosine-5)-methyltransferase 1